jgi:hypothetical protein
MASQPNQPGKTSLAKPVAGDARRVVDHLPQAFDVAAGESEWLLTLLGAGDLRYIFEGKDHD